MSATVTVTEQDFQDVVLSATVPVLVDFWAEWCGPCKGLAPILEKLAAEYGERLIVAKVNVDEQQELATAAAIRSLPTMMLFVDGRPVEQIVGAQPEANIRAVIDRFVNEEGPGDGNSADSNDESPLGSINESDYSLAKLESLLQEDPDNLQIKLAIARIRIVDGDLETASEMLKSLSEDDGAGSETKQVAAALEFARASANTPSAVELSDKLNNEPDNLAARCQLGVQKVALGEYDEASAEFLTVLRKNRNFDEGRARTLLLALIDLLGPEDPRVSVLRREMMSALY